MRAFVLVFVCSLLCFEGGAVQAEDGSKGWEPHGSLSFTLQERYIGLRASRLVHDDWMLWSSLRLELPQGFFANFWNSYGLDDLDFSSNSGDEIDTTLGWQGGLYGFELHLSVTFFNLHPIERWWDDDNLVQTIAVAKNFPLANHSIRPECRVEWVSEADDYSGGTVVLLPNVTHNWYRPFGIGPLTFSHNTMFAWDDGFDKPKNSSDGVFLRWSGGLQWSLAENLTLTLPGFTALVPLTEPGDGRKEETSWNTCISFAF